MYKLHDFECDRCGHMWEALVGPGEDAVCPSSYETSLYGLAVTIACLGHGTALPFVCGTATRAQVNPAKTREMFSKSAEMMNKITGKTPWRRNSYSQTGNE